MACFENLFIATKNSGKMAEFERMLRDCALKILQMDAIAVPDVEETGKTFLENARIKAERARRFVLREIAVMGDDSGICIDALGGAPGIYSARYAGGNYTAAMDRVLKGLQGVAENGRGAYFSCVLYLIAPDGGHHVFEGRVEGTIASGRRGEGLGYDPIFMANGLRKTFGEMPKGEKDGASARGLAVRKFLHWLEFFGGAGDPSATGDEKFCLKSAS